MATVNPFDLLGDDAEDPSQFVAAQLDKPAKAPAPAPAQPAKPAAKLPTKPLPPAQAVKESRSADGGGRGGGRGYGRGRGGGGFNRDSRSNDVTGITDEIPGGFRASEGDGGKPTERRGYGGPRGSFRGGRRGGFSNGDAGDGERPRRLFERRSGTGRGNEIKREGAGRGNWGTTVDEIARDTEEVAVEHEKSVGVEKQPGEEDVADANKESPVEPEEKEPEDKEMTLEEYEKLLEEKRKALQAVKTEERKVDTKEFESMQQLSNKKSNDEVFIKLGLEKEKRKDSADKEEKARKSVNINEFFKPAGESYYGRGGRGRGRGRGSRGGGYGGNQNNAPAPSFDDPGQFPSLGGK